MKVNYKVITLEGKRKIALGKIDGGYAIQFGRPATEDDNETSKTAIMEIKNGEVNTMIKLSPEALQALVSLYVEDQEKQGYGLMVKTAKKDT